MSALWRIVPCHACRGRWWLKRSCRWCEGHGRVAVSVTPEEMQRLAYTTFDGSLYRSEESANVAIRRMG